MTNGPLSPASCLLTGVSSSEAGQMGAVALQGVSEEKQCDNMEIRPNHE